MDTAVTTENLDKFLKAIGRDPYYVDLEVFSTHILFCDSKSLYNIKSKRVAICCYHF